MGQRKHAEGKKSKLFIQTVDLPYEGEGEEGTNP